jgi:Domain of unknown function (DUF4338)
MDTELRYRGRAITSNQVAQIAELIAAHPSASRRALSIQVCQAWNWVQPNGALCDAVCRGLLLTLHRAGRVTLPEPEWRSSRPARRSRVQPIELPEIPIEGPLSGLGPIVIEQVRRTPREALVEGLVARYHYLGYKQPVGEHLKYLVTAGDQPIACFCWSSAPRHLGPRDRYIGWPLEVRKANLRGVAYQSRFLILPWVRVPHLASHLLGRMARQISADWKRVYAHPIYFTETFVDPTRYRGTCYRAANWVCMGRTTGRGKDDHTHRPNRSVKDVWGYPLVRDFRRRLLAC